MKYKCKRIDGPCGRCYQLGSCKVMVTLDGGREHLSISHKNRYPRWDEIKQARYELLDKDKCYAMYLPPEEYYVNEHKNCFHLWEVKENV